MIQGGTVMAKWRKDPITERWEIWASLPEALNNPEEVEVMKANGDKSFVGVRRWIFTEDMQAHSLPCRIEDYDEGDYVSVFEHGDC
jgi:hypothetical protein